MGKKLLKLCMRYVATAMLLANFLWSHETWKNWNPLQVPVTVSNFFPPTFPTTLTW